MLNQLYVYMCIHIHTERSIYVYTHSGHTYTYMYIYMHTYVDREDYEQKLTTRKMERMTYAILVSLLGWKRDVLTVRLRL